MPPDADALALRLLDALMASGGTAAPSAAAHAAALSLLDDTFPELRHFSTGGAVTASPAAGDADPARGEYFRTTGALFALALCLAAGADDGRAADALQLLTGGERGPMSLNGVVGAGISLGHAPAAFASFCAALRACAASPEERWALFVLVAVHDCGKSDAFRGAVNAALPRHARSEDHDRALAAALADAALTATLLPSVAALPAASTRALAAAAAAGCHLPQLGQGEAPLAQLAALAAALAAEPALRAPRALNAYLYHSVFDVAGAACGAAFVLPLAVTPVFVGFAAAKDALLGALLSPDTPGSVAAADVYYAVLRGPFTAAYPAFAARDVAAREAAAGAAAWRAGRGLALLRLLALTRNTYAAPHEALAALDDGDVVGGQDDETAAFRALERELCAAPCDEDGDAPPQPAEVLVYYGPDMVRMGLGAATLRSDEGGAGLRLAMRALADLFALARSAAAAGAAAARTADADAQTPPVYELNVAAAVAAIRTAGAGWGGGGALRSLLAGAAVEAGATPAEGRLKLA